MKRDKIVIVGGGSAGLSVAARLCAQKPAPEITIVEPSEKHWYQPLWTLVGAGVFPRQASERPEADYIPPGAIWVRDAVMRFEPERNAVKTQGGRTISYDYLVVAPGLQLDWARIRGLAGHVGRDGICSNYSYETVESTWQALRAFSGGTALFTQPSTAVKCGGAPQKICYLAEDYFRQIGLRKQSHVVFASGTKSIFAVPKYAAALERVITRKGIETLFQHELVEVRPVQREAVFQRLDNSHEVVLSYDLLHVTPPTSAPDVVKRSPLVDSIGWVEVDSKTLQHIRYPNVYSLGDASNLPTSKTGAAIRKQAPVLVANLTAQRRGLLPSAQYDGYTSCPLVTGYGSLILAEFDYEKRSCETFPFNQAKERRSMYLLKAYGLPRLYWHGMLRGRL